MFRTWSESAAVSCLLNELGLSLLLYPSLLNEQRSLSEQPQDYRHHGLQRSCISLLRTDVLIWNEFTAHALGGQHND